MTTTSYRSRSAVGVRHFFPSRRYSAVRSRLGARGTMTTTSYRSRSAVGVRHIFPSRHYPAVRSRLGAKRNDDNNLANRSVVCVRHLFCRGTQSRVLVHAER
ncbi:hypothetical protein TNCV_5003971 [Trichonephila clavipes]|nr:hypothetical protein TNCV_5003971 [Trichonephila clavipes]